MRAVVQRVLKSSVTVDGKVVGKIGKGFCVLLGVAPEDTEQDVAWMAEKIAFLRVFEDENAKMNLSLQDVGGSILAISQFTLYGDCDKGRRPSFTGAGHPALAKKRYEQFLKAFEKWHIPVEAGIFQSDMKVEILNDGPVTLIINSPIRKSFSAEKPPKQDKFEKEAALLKRNLQLRQQQKEKNHG